MVSKVKIAFFDFCETLVNFQTADRFVDFARQRFQSRHMLRLENLRCWLYDCKIITVLEIITFYKCSINKKLKLYQLKGLSKDELENLAADYYVSIIKQNIIEPVLKQLLNLQKDGYKIVLVSGGYDIYLKHFAAEYGVEEVISTRIGFNKSKLCTGYFYGVDCLHKNKIKLLENKYNRNEIECMAFSDSASDIPLLLWADRAYVISKGQHQSWQEKYNFNEIIW